MTAQVPQRTTPRLHSHPGFAPTLRVCAQAEQRKQLEARSAGAGTREVAAAIQKLPLKEPGLKVGAGAPPSPPLLLLWAPVRPLFPPLLLL